MDDSTVEKEVEMLKTELVRVGDKQDDGTYDVTFGVLFDDERCQDIFEALVGTLKAAKKRKVVAYDAPLLLKGAHDNVVIKLLVPPAAASAAEGSESKE